MQPCNINCSYDMSLATTLKKDAQQGSSVAGACSHDMALATTLEKDAQQGASAAWDGGTSKAQQKCISCCRIVTDPASSHSIRASRPDLWPRVLAGEGSQQKSHSKVGIPCSVKSDTEQQEFELTNGVSPDHGQPSSLSDAGEDANLRKESEYSRDWSNSIA
eukprot:scaffold321920_cov15-Tisochrysis_lutea.AAC.1